MMGGPVFSMNNKLNQSNVLSSNRVSVPCYIYLPVSGSVLLFIELEATWYCFYQPQVKLLDIKVNWKFAVFFLKSYSPGSLH